MATPQHGDWRFDLCEGGASNANAGTLITTLNPYVQDRVLDFKHNRPCSVTGKIPSSLELVSDVYADGYPNMYAMNRTLKCFRYESGSWVIRFNGIIWLLGAEANEDGAMYTTFTAFDPWQFLFKRLIRRNDGNLRKKTTLANNAGAAIKRHIDKTILYAGPCYIDTDGFFEPALPYLTFEYVREYIGRAFIEVCDTGAVDVIMEPVDRTNGELVVASAVGLRGNDVSATVKFEYDTGARHAKEWAREVNGDVMANFIINASGDNKKFSEADDTDSSDIFGVMEDSRTITDIVHQDLLDALTGQELVMRAAPHEVVTAVPMPTVAADPFNDYNIGDLVTVAAAATTGEAVNAIQRVYGFRIEPDNDGVERVTELTASPNQG